MLKLNLLPPTLTQRAIKWCKGIPATLCFLPVFLLALLFLPLAYVAFKFYEWGYSGGCAIGRRWMGVQRLVSMDKAIEIATRAVEGEGRGCRLGLRERFSTYDIRIELLPTASSLDACKAMQLTVDMRDGRILTSTVVPCEHGTYLQSTNLLGSDALNVT